MSRNSRLNFTRAIGVARKRFRFPNPMFCEVCPLAHGPHVGVKRQPNGESECFKCEFAGKPFGVVTAGLSGLVTAPFRNLVKAG
jgi:hypothetical protein